MGYLAASLRATLLPALAVVWVGFLAGCDKLYETRIEVDATARERDEMLELIQDALERSANDADIHLRTEQFESPNAIASYTLVSRPTGRDTALEVDQLAAERWVVKVLFFGPGYSRSHEPEPYVIRFEEAVIPELEDIVGADNVSVDRDWR